MRKSMLCIAGLLALSLAMPISAQIGRDSTIRVVAGGGPAGAGGEGLALSIPLEGPTGVIVGPDGAIYISEFQGGRVRRIDASGRMATITGGGNLLMNGEKGPAIMSAIMGPASLAFDRNGNLYIAEQLGNRIRRINRKGVISTFAGTGAPGPIRDGVPATESAVNGPNGLVFDSRGNLYVSEFLGNRIRKISPKGIITTVAGIGKTVSSGDGGPALEAGIYGPTGLALDRDGNLLVAEIIGNRVRKIDPSGTISTLVDNINGPSALAITRQNELLIAEHFGEKLHRLGADGRLTTLLNTDVYGVAVDANDNIRIAQITVGRVGRLEAQASPAAEGSAVAYSLVFEAGVEGRAGNPAQPDVSLKMPAGVAYDADGNLYIAEITGNRIRKVDTNGGVSFVAGNSRRGFSGDGGPAVDAGLDGPGTIGFDDNGNMYIVEIIGNRIRRVDRNGVITTIAGTGEAGFGGDGGPAIHARFNHAHWGAYDRATGAIIIVDTLNHRIRQIDRNGIITTIGGTGEAASRGDGGLLINASFNRPENVVIDNEGNWFISEGAGHRIRKVSPQGIVSTVAGTGKAGYSGNGKKATRAKFNGPTGLALDDEGNLYIADSFNSVIRRLDRDGRIHLIAGTPGQRGMTFGPAAGSRLVSPWGLAYRKGGVRANSVAGQATESENLTAADVCPGLVLQEEASGEAPAVRRKDR